MIIGRFISRRLNGSVWKMKQEIEAARKHGPTRYSTLHIERSSAGRFRDCRNRVTFLSRQDCSDSNANQRNTLSCFQSTSRRVHRRIHIPLSTTQGKRLRHNRCDWEEDGPSRCTWVWHLKAQNACQEGASSRAQWTYCSQLLLHSKRTRHDIRCSNSAGILLLDGLGISRYRKD